MEEKSCVFSVSLGENMLQSESSCFLPPEESMLSLHSWHFSRIHPVVGSRQSPCLISASDASPKLFISAQRLKQDSQKTRGACARRNGFTTCFCREYYLVCTGSLWWFRGWMIIRGSLSWTSQTWIKILYFSCETWPLKIIKKNHPEKGCFFIWGLKVSLTWPAVWPCRWKWYV